MGRDWPGSSGNVPDDGGKSWRFYELLDSAVRNLSWHGTRVLSSTSSQKHLWLGSCATMAKREERGNPFFRKFNTSH